MFLSYKQAKLTKCQENKPFYSYLSHCTDKKYNRSASEFKTSLAAAHHKAHVLQTEQGHFLCIAPLILDNNILQYICHFQAPHMRSKVMT